MSVLSTHNIVKHYPGAVALNDVNVSFESGKIHSIIGKNGSGKSTLLKIISGSETATSGSIRLNGVELIHQNTAEALKKGIVTVYQELSLINSLSVAENLYMGNLPTKKNGLVNWGKMYADCDAYLQSVGLGFISSRMPVAELGVAGQQMIEILKAMSRKPKILLLDEPTSALSQQEVNTLFDFMRRLKEQDIIIIFVTHRLQELWMICDTCTVLRDGILIGSIELQKTGRSTLLDMMFGSVAIRSKPADLTTSIGDDIMLYVEDLNFRDKFKNITFQLRRGEVLGIAGMVGAGRTELLRAIFGAEPYDSGRCSLEGHEILNATPEKMKQLGVAMVQEDRANNGIIKTLNIKDNLCVAALKAISSGFFIDGKKELMVSNEMVEQVEIKIASLNDFITTLSGGNQQKVILGRWLAARPKVILFDELSRGIDVGTKQQIFQKIWDLSMLGISSIVVSSELEELLEVCTRILVMRGGQFTEEILNTETVTVDELYMKCMGEGVL